MSGAEAFFDTNVLLYLISDDEAKAARSEALLSEGGTISVQVLNEFAAVALRKRGLTFGEVRDVLATIRRVCAVAPLDPETHDLGLELAERHRLSIYDGFILAAALRAGCAILYSEDFQADRQFGGLAIRNPFGM